MNRILNEINQIIKQNINEYLPEVKPSDLEENGTVYYMNGKNGTEFDWYVNEHLPGFMVFYNNKQNLGAVKLLIYIDGEVAIYIYGDKGNKLVKEVQTSIKVAENELFNLAVILKSEADDKNIWDASICKINTDVEITKEEITKFQDFEQYMEPTKNRMKLLNQTAYLSKKILEEGRKVGYMYRDEPENENDSGWTFCAGNEDNEYCDDYKNIELVSVHEVYQIDPDIWNYIDNPVGTELIRISSKEFEIDKRDKEIFMELNDKVYDEIKQRSARGNELADTGHYQEALNEFKKALELLPQPVYMWEAATWLYVSVGDMHFQLNDYSDSLDSFLQAQKCPDGLGNPFICVRIGECYFELGNMEKAKEYLMQAYMLEGEEIFLDADPKYLALILPLV